MCVFWLVRARARKCVVIYILSRMNVEIIVVHIFGCSRGFRVQDLVIGLRLTYPMLCHGTVNCNAELRQVKQHEEEILIVLSMIYEF